MSLPDQELTQPTAITVEIPTYHSDTFKLETPTDTTYDPGQKSPAWSREKIIECDWLAFTPHEIPKIKTKTNFSVEEEVNIFEDSLENIRSQSPGGLQAQESFGKEFRILAPTS
jgi:hypothetical protein